MTAASLRLTMHTTVQQCHLMLSCVIFRLAGHRSQLAPLSIEGSAERNFPDDDSMQLTFQSLIAHTHPLAFLQHTLCLGSGELGHADNA